MSENSPGHALGGFNSSSMLDRGDYMPERR
jgi:hypothetical protein